MWKNLEERNLAIIETVMNELGVSDIEELLAKVIELKVAAEHALALDALPAGWSPKPCPTCGQMVSNH